MAGSTTQSKPSTSYRQLINGYTESWAWIKKIQNSLFHTNDSWFGKRPWQRRKIDLHDHSNGNLIDFHEHLEAVKMVMDEHLDRTDGTMIICCWNEFGEGSYIESTKKYQFRYLQAIKDVFGSN